MLRKKYLPTNAIVAITLNCNSQCVMCDIWKNNIKDELLPKDYLNLPSSLTDINITGGEPFLRKDIVDIIKNIKTSCPKARLIINTNGLLPKKIQDKISQIIAIDSKIAIRISVDGMEKTHNLIRRQKNGFNLTLQTITLLQKNKIKDLGISFTIMEQNYLELPLIYNFCQKNNLELSLTIASDSPIYFGKNKTIFRPQNFDKLKKEMLSIINSRYKKNNIKENFRSWFDQKLLDYFRDSTRQYTCDAGKDFFYLDSVGNVFACHLKNQKIGNIKNNSFQEMWATTKIKNIRQENQKCNDCWMICSSKTNIKKNILPISLEIIKQKTKLWLKR